MKTGRSLVHLDDTIVVILKLETQGRAKTTELEYKEVDKHSPRERLQQVPAGRSLRSLSPRPSPANAMQVIVAST
jgi:hypothetical protein